MRISKNERRESRDGLEGVVPAVGRLRACARGSVKGGVHPSATLPDKRESYSYESFGHNLTARILQLRIEGVIFLPPLLDTPVF